MGRRPANPGPAVWGCLLLYAVNLGWLLGSQFTAFARGPSALPNGSTVEDEEIGFADRFRLDLPVTGR
ncbi:hypothetical protein Aph01nite_22360 [Acrocarpospora phusangensis]|uniref:Uncharacterized protein n=1 Tax=Acrocarpospora phusangensis TaxID=1070424 RepID=A0A919UJK0_9ACTN|nr:hypothetical protein Aph01nite_22360 [Acrocarpospora phusangensis]